MVQAYARRAADAAAGLQATQACPLFPPPHPLIPPLFSLLLAVTIVLCPLCFLYVMS